MDRAKLTRYFYATLTEYNQHEQKYALLEGYGVSSTSELTDKQLQELIDNIRHNAAQDADKKLKEKRGLCLRLLTDIGVYYVEKGESNKACWNRVNDFVKQSKISGKIFYNHSLEDLEILSKKLRALKQQGYYKTQQSQVTQAVGQSVNTVVTIPISLNTSYKA